MSGHNRRRRGTFPMARFALILSGILGWTIRGEAQSPPVVEDPGIAVLGPDAVPASFEPVLPPQVQIVRFQGPEGVLVEVLGPQPEPVPIGDGHGLGTFGLRVGVGYQLRVSNLPARPGVELFPVVEIVGHLHRPPGIDPAKYPIRIQINPEDINDVVVRGHLVTQIIYLEDPDQALPLSLPKDQIPVVSLNPSEEPLKVGAALGRVMAIMRLGGRQPLPENLDGTPMMPLTGPSCPFTGPDGGRCPLPCGPVRGTPPPAGRPWMPKDEFLCDGGDRGVPAGFGDGGLRGIDPRDAVVQFRDDLRTRVLPTNTVCVYAPRFAAVRTSIGPNENLAVQYLRGAESLQRQVTHEIHQEARRMTQNQTAAAHRGRSRLSGMVGRITASSHSEIKVLGSADVVTHIAGSTLVQGPELSRNRQKIGATRTNIFAQGTKLAEGTVVTGIVEGAGEQVMAWKPQEIASVEVPPNKPGIAVIKRVDAVEAEPGDVLTYTIQYRNMGNIPITSVSVLDSLLPRLEYMAGSARGPAGTVFTADENLVGGMELRWDLGTVPPGGEGYVSFQARVR